MDIDRVEQLQRRKVCLHRLAQMLSAVPANLFLLVTLNDEYGLLGLRDRMTEPGFWLLGMFGLMVLVSGVAMLRARRWGVYLGAAGLALMVPPFLFSMQSDWLIGAIGMCFNGALGLTLGRDAGGMFRAAPAARQAVWPGATVLWLSGLTVVMSIIEAGYRASHAPWALGASVFVAACTLGFSCIYERRHVRPRLRGGPYAEWIVLLAVPAAVYTGSVMLVIGVIAVRQAIVFARLSMRTRMAAQATEYLFRQPAQLLSLSFLGVILAGTLVLSFPYASATGVPVRLVNALFTATSATCVTGLTVLDTPRDFSLFGQFVILALIQIGGLGIMTISTFTAIVMGRSIGLGSASTLSEMVNELSLRKVFRLIKFICLSTLCIEAAGAVALTAAFIQAGSPLRDGIWRGVFHSVSAFCNAGFALQSDNLCSMAHRPAILWTVSLLLVAGGIGFGVLYWAYERITGAVQRMSLHVRAVLVVTGVLMVGGVAVMMVAERTNTFAGWPLIDQITNAWFHAVTPRTAGFNTVPVEHMRPVSRLITALFMFIGGAPGGTAGGIKVTTVFVLAMTVSSLIRGDRTVRGFGCTLAPITVFRATAVFALAAAAVAAGAAVLMATQNLPAETMLFETVSAFGTVGLSMGATPLLNDIGKLVVIAIMFVGRVGPLTLVLSLRPMRRQDLYYPLADVMVG
ncbi:hypothetical protein GX586_04025 [bacterium]|nr:hypothetical protein [bacterium]